MTDENDLIKKVTTIPKEHLATLVPVINDLITFVSRMVNLFQFNIFNLYIIKN